MLRLKKEPFTTPGKTEGKRCSVCNAVLTAHETIPTQGHDFTGAYSNDANGHWHKCSRCDATDEKTAHTYDTTDCTRAAACTVCAYEKAAGTHTWGEWVQADEANLSASAPARKRKPPRIPGPRAK